MNFQISGNNFDISDNTKKLVEEKLGNLINKYFPNISNDQYASVRINQDKYDHFKVAFEMNLPGRLNLFADSKHVSLESTLVDLREEIETQIKKFKQSKSNTSLS